MKLITSLIYADHTLADDAINELKQKWGEIDILESAIPFHFTDYYYKEMGRPLYRHFFSFKKLIERSRLVESKIISNQIENRLAKTNGCRTLNVDPGYLTDSQMILATGKNFSHRVYLGEGIFADLTLIFERGEYNALPWTYPDYRDSHMRGLLSKIRDQYLKDKKEYE